MRKIIIMVLFLFSLLLSGCKDENKAWEPYSPENTTSLMLQFAYKGNIEQFKTLFLDGMDEDYLLQIYETVRSAENKDENETSFGEVSTFTLVSLENGKTFLVELTPPIPNKNDEVLIQDVIELPKEIRDYIEEELNRKYNK
ncbi:hypothetical protein F4694_001116 [Bacillus niacini]|uniref:Uncharacterized protein n=1 Tax=Neobacillus niacini TaxID=86668 RepID=A0A852T6J9_9BACI|nr:hypothetical protein [Neobacillus niacini]NYE04372.1 hypothetical protein [Neobacillus niacini]